MQEQKQQTELNETQVKAVVGGNAEISADLLQQYSQGAHFSEDTKDANMR
jgi:hypothetical protein